MKNQTSLRFHRFKSLSLIITWRRKPVFILTFQLSLPIRSCSIRHLHPITSFILINIHKILLIKWGLRRVDRWDLEWEKYHATEIKKNKHFQIIKFEFKALANSFFGVWQMFIIPVKELYKVDQLIRELQWHDVLQTLLVSFLFSMFITITEACTFKLKGPNFLSQNLVRGCRGVKLTSLAGLGLPSMTSEGQTDIGRGRFSSL